MSGAYLWCDGEVAMALETLSRPGFPVIYQQHTRELFINVFYKLRGMFYAPVF
jgi:hypothetical protein